MNSALDRYIKALPLQRERDYADACAHWLRNDTVEQPSHPPLMGTSRAAEIRQAVIERLLTRE